MQPQLLFSAWECKAQLLHLQAGWRKFNSENLCWIFQAVPSPAVETSAWLEQSLYIIRNNLIILYPLYTCTNAIILSMWSVFFFFSLFRAWSWWHTSRLWRSHKPGWFILPIFQPDLRNIGSIPPNHFYFMIVKFLNCNYYGFIVCFAFILQCPWVSERHL